MQHHENMKTKLSGPEFYDANQREVTALAEALERWLDDGGASDDDAVSEGGVGDFSHLQLLQPQGGLL